MNAITVANTSSNDHASTAIPHIMEGARKDLKTSICPVYFSPIKSLSLLISLVYSG